MASARGMREGEETRGLWTEEWWWVNHQVIEKDARNKTGGE